MKLSEFFERECINMAAFARKCHVSLHPLRKARAGEPIRYYLAQRIARATDGKVTVEEIATLPAPRYIIPR